MKKLKKSLVLLCSLAMVTLMATLSVSAASSDFVIEDGVLTAYNGPGGDVVIPDEVVQINQKVFYESTTLTSIVIGDNVTKPLYCYTFRNCVNLKEATIGAGQRCLESNLFEGCSSLETIHLGEGMTSIWREAFDGCTSLETITLPDSMTDILDNAFIGCPNLKTIILGPNIDWIGAGSIPDGALLQVPEGTISATVAQNFASNHATINWTYAPSQWARGSVTQATELELVPLSLQRDFTNTITRSEFCALGVALYEAAKDTEITQRATFTDTTDVNVEKMAGLGVVDGTGDGAFSPAGLLTREQAATILARLSNVMGKPLTAQDATFADNDTISSWALPAIGQMQVSGIMGGVGDNRFAPKDAYTREQSILTILRLYQAVTGEELPDTQLKAPTEIRINDTWDFTCYVGKTHNLPIVFSPAGSGGVTLTWTSSNPAVATVNDSGLVTAVGAGVSTITVTTSNGLSASLDVTITAYAMNTAAALNLKTGESSTLPVAFVPRYLEDEQTVSFASNNPAVAVVNTSGKVTAVGPGTATITLTSSDGLTTACVVTATGTAVTPPADVNNLDYAAYAKIALKHYHDNLKVPSSMKVTNLEYMVYHRAASLSDARFPLDDDYLVIRATIEAMNSLGVMVSETYVSLFDITDGSSRHDLVGYADWLIDTYSGQTKLDGFDLKNEALQLKAHTGFTPFTDTVIADLTAQVKQ